MFNATALVTLLIQIVFTHYPWRGFSYIFARRESGASNVVTYERDQSSHALIRQRGLLIASRNKYSSKSI